MLKKAIVLTGATAGLLALAPVAHATSQDNDGINILNDSNVSVIPIQLCGNNVIGPIVPVASKQDVKCTQASIIKGK